MMARTKKICILMIKVNKLDSFFVSRYCARDLCSHGISRSPKFIHGTVLNTHITASCLRKQASEGTETETETETETLKSQVVCNPGLRADGGVKFSCLG